MAIIDVINFNDPNNVLVWGRQQKAISKRTEELGLGIQLVVNQSQQVIVIEGGQLLDVFELGPYMEKTGHVSIA